MRSMLFSGVLAALAATARPAPSTATSAQQRTAADLLVTAQWLKQHLASPDLVVLQTGMTRAGFDQAHIPGARFAPLMEFHAHGETLPDPAAIADRLGRLGVANQSRVVIAGNPLAASILFVALDYVGHGARTAVLDGGLTAWRSAGGAVTADTTAVLAARFTAAPRTDLAVDAAWIRQRLGQPGVALLDARTRGEYDGTAPEQLPRRGHLPGAAHLNWISTFDPRDLPGGGGPGSDDNPPSTARLKPKAELAALFARSGAEPGDVAVTYCTVGMRASHLYFVARLLGYDARLYVGSMADWVRDPGRPVVQASAAP